MDIIFTIIVFVTAAAVQGAAGFGFGLVAVGLLGSLLPIKDASVTLVLASLTLNCFIFYRLRSHFRWDRVLPMIVSTLVGVPLGVWILVAASEVLLHRLLGVVLLVTVVQNFLPGIGDKRWHPVGLGVPCGLFSGALAGAFATGGPPAVAYVSSQHFTRFRYSATLQLALGTSAVMRILCLGVSGQFTPRILLLSGLGIVCAIAGAWIGLHCLKWLSDEHLKKVVLAVLFVLGLKYLFL